MLKLSIEKGAFKDTQGREVVLRGINFAADAKLPAVPYTPSHAPDNDEWYQGDDVSFVGSPFPLADADSHLERLKVWGFNSVRYIFTWEALEHSGPGIYDEEFIDFTIQILHKLKKYEFYVIMDPHQDVWARFCGGSGAPMWTLYAAGLNPRNFKATHAALLEHHFANNPQDRPKMMWASNYHRLAAATLFTLFFAGKMFAPKCIINGVNIQEYLESHYINACKRLAERIYAEKDSLADSVIGWESMNEPGHGYIGDTDLKQIPKSQQVKLYTCPNASEGMALGSGIAQTVPRFEFGGMGPKVVDSKFTIDPKGISAWLTPAEATKIDQNYGWTRGSEWETGRCIWNLHGVWKLGYNDSIVVLRPDYFAFDLQGHPVDHTRFVEEIFIDHWTAYTKALRQVAPEDSFMFLQPPVMARPPNLKNRGLVDKHLVYSPHYYDGLTLMLKHWNRNFNVDAVGVIRGKYANPPVMAIRLGERNIRQCLGDQLKTLKQEGIDALGPDVPCLITEIGVPYDMDDCQAYRTGDFTSQSRSMDANNHALEYAQLSHTLWVYTAKNTNVYGDGWNGEDLAIWSTDPVVNADYTVSKTPSNSLIKRMRSPTTTALLEHSTSNSSGNSAAVSDSPSQSSDNYVTSSHAFSPKFHDPYPYLIGARAPEAFIRPVPVSVSGKILKYGFNLAKCTFTLKIEGNGKTDPKKQTSDGSEMDNLIPTVLFIPSFHFPVHCTGVSTSAGIWKIDRVNQLLYWWHLAGPQRIQVTGRLTPLNDTATVSSEKASSQSCIIS